MAPFAVVSFNHCPPGHATLKYEGLGAIAGWTLAQYCGRHGYVLRNLPPDLNRRQACWAKIPALLAALQDHPVAVWVDSDAVVANPQLQLEDFLTEGHDMVFQQPERLFAPLRAQPGLSRQRQPVNTGVFMVRRCEWTLDLLRQAYALAPIEAKGTPWNGLGDQEAMTLALSKRPDPFARVAWVQGLQTLPQDACHDALTVHFYGDHGEGCVPAALCREVVNSYGPQVANLRADASKMALLHWCAIQNLTPAGPLRRGGPERFGYDAALLARAQQEFTV